MKLSEHSPKDSASVVSPQAEVLRYYRFHSRIYDLTRWTYLRGRKAAMRALDLCTGEHVLEVGCGTGLNFRPIVQAIGPRGQLTAIDLSAEMLARARRRCMRHVWDNVDLYPADAETFDLGRRFDKVLSAYAVSMIGDLPRCLERMVAHLKPAGKLVLLDFGGLAGWPRWVRRSFAAWMRTHYVHVERDPVPVLEQMGLDVQRHWLLAGYAMVVTAQHNQASEHADANDSHRHGAAECESLASHG